MNIIIISLRGNDLLIKYQDWIQIIDIAMNIFYILVNVSKRRIQAIYLPHLWCQLNPIHHRATIKMIITTLNCRMAQSLLRWRRTEAMKVFSYCLFNQCNLLKYVFIFYDLLTNAQTAIYITILIIILFMSQFPLFT